MPADYKTLIAETKITAFEKALQQTFHTTDIDDISLVSGGLSGSALYRITVNGQPYALKFDAHQAAQAAALTAVLQQVSGAGISPGLYYRDEEQGLSITGFIAHQPMQAVLSPEQISVNMGTTIRKLHSLSCELKANNLQQTVDFLIAGFRQSAIISGPAIDECLQYYDQLKQAYPWDRTDKVVSHNDLNPGNILFDGKQLWLIDWDEVSLNDPYIDLAAAANFFVHTDEHERLLLHTYFDREPTALEHAHLFVVRQLSRLIYGLLMFQVAAKSKPADHVHNQTMEDHTLRLFGEKMRAGEISLANYEGQLFYAKANFNEALRQMRSARFAESLLLLA